MACIYVEIRQFHSLLYVLHLLPLLLYISSILRWSFHIWSMPSYCRRGCGCNCVATIKLAPVSVGQLRPAPTINWVNHGVCMRVWMSHPLPPRRPPPCVRLFPYFSHCRSMPVESIYYWSSQDRPTESHFGPRPPPRLLPNGITNLKASPFLDRSVGIAHSSFSSSSLSSSSSSSIAFFSHCIGIIVCSCHYVFPTCQQHKDNCVCV